MYFQDGWRRYRSLHAPIILQGLHPQFSHMQTNDDDILAYFREDIYEDQLDFWKCYTFFRDLKENKYNIFYQMHHKFLNRYIEFIVKEKIGIKSKKYIKQLSLFSKTTKKYMDKQVSMHPHENIMLNCIFVSWHLQLVWPRHTKEINNTEKFIKPR